MTPERACLARATLEDVFLADEHGAGAVVVEAVSETWSQAYVTGEEWHGWYPLSKLKAKEEL